jgi:hypothetical protein
LIIVDCRFLSGIHTASAFPKSTIPNQQSPIINASGRELLIVDCRLIIVDCHFLSRIQSASAVPQINNPQSSMPQPPHQRRAR